MRKLGVNQTQFPNLHHLTTCNCIPLTEFTSSHCNQPLRHQQIFSFSQKWITYHLTVSYGLCKCWIIIYPRNKTESSNQSLVFLHINHQHHVQFIWKIFWLKSFILNYYFQLSIMTNWIRSIKTKAMEYEIISFFEF